jgi:para-nitrobenzyl esterase
MLRSLLALIALPCMAPVCLAMDTMVKLDSGKISGAEANGVASFKGIPYVAAPIGELRWKAPHTIAPWTATRSAKDYGAACPQPAILEKGYGIKFDNMGEDCLTLNVWSAANNSAERRPVLFWIHGGGNVAGAGSITDGSTLAKLGAVVVTINYRLGPFGFLSLPSLSNESSRHSSGNYGLLDQVAALLWVHRNIDKFGGDPQKVTVFGESAGGTDIGWLMTSPLAKGLFHRAIVESGVMFLPGDPRLQTAEQAGVKLFGDTLAALRLRTTKEIMGTAGFQTDMIFGSSGASYGPVVDGWVIPEDPTLIFESGRQANVPLIVGTNADEGSVFTENLPFKTVADYRSYLTSHFFLAADALFKLYPAGDDAEVHPAASRLVTDSVFLTSARRLARAQVPVNAKTFMYHFTHATGPLGAFHGSEIPFVFAADSGNALAKVMSSAWVRFAATGDPGWPAYTAAADQYMEFGDTIKAGSELHKKEIDALTAFYEALRPRTSKR